MSKAWFFSTNCYQQYTLYITELNNIKTDIYPEPFYEKIDECNTTGDNLNSFIVNPNKSYGIVSIPKELDEQNLTSENQDSFIVNANNSYGINNVQMDEPNATCENQDSFTVNTNASYGADNFQTMGNHNQLITIFNVAYSRESSTCN